MPIVKLQCECKVCKKPMVIPVEAQALRDAGEQVEIFAKWLTCEACLISLGRIRKPKSQPELPVQPANQSPSQPPSDHD